MPKRVTSDKPYYSMEVLLEAAKLASRNRKNKKEVAEFEMSKMALLRKLHISLKNHTYRSSPYKLFKRREGKKVREVADLPLYPDRIAQWAVCIVIEDKVNSKLVDQTHGSRKGHGIHSAKGDIQKYLGINERYAYCLSIDVTQFFASIPKDRMKQRVREVIKDKEVIWFLDTVIDGYPNSGIAIGDRVSPMLANMYLSPLDHWLKEVRHVHGYSAYMDDRRILGFSKPWLHQIRREIADYLQTIGLEMKDDWQIFPIDKRGIAYVGYRVYSKDHVRLLKKSVKRIKRQCARMNSKLDRGEPLDKHDYGVIASYKGMLKWCNGWHLYETTLKVVEDRNRELGHKLINESLAEKTARRIPANLGE